MRAMKCFSFLSLKMMSELDIYLMCMQTSIEFQAQQKRNRHFFLLVQHIKVYPAKNNQTLEHWFKMETIEIVTKMKMSSNMKCKCHGNFSVFVQRENRNWLNIYHSQYLSSNLIIPSITKYQLKMYKLIQKYSVQNNKGTVHWCRGCWVAYFVLRISISIFFYLRIHKTSTRNGKTKAFYQNNSAEATKQTKSNPITFVKISIFSLEIHQSSSAQAI